MKLPRVLLALMLFGSFVMGAQSASQYDVLELPAVPSELASETLIYNIEKFGDRHFATGHRGHILYSDDGGDTWTQAEVPVRSSITGIHFPTPELGWAVGHEGVILHSTDGGKTWAKQYDGLRYGTEGLAFYEALAEADPDNEDYPFLVEEMEFAISQGADKPLFGVYFHNEKFGHAMGAYGMILRTTDGGLTWEHALHNMENESFYHVFDFAPLPQPGRFFLSGEAGLLMVGDIKEQKGKRVHSVPWEGSFFANTDTEDGAIVMGGLRGRMFRTDDAGESWTVVKKPPSSAIVDAVRLEDDRLIAVTIGGQVLMSADNGFNFKSLPITAGPLSSGERIYAVAEGSPGTILVGGPTGIRKLTLPQ